MAAFVILDAGTGGAKCAIFDVNGHQLATHRIAWTYDVRPNADFPYIKEFSFAPDAFWRLLCECTRAALARSGIRPADVLGVAATSQREGCVFLDAAGREIYAGPNFDARGFNEGLEVLNTLGAERLYQITGHSAPFIFPVVRYLWFRKHDRRTVARLLMLNDWMTYRLCGALASEPSNATESMLFDLRGRAWSQEILDLFAIPQQILPAIRQPGERVGALSAVTAAATGLAEGTPVFVGGADTQCGLLGAGALEPGDTAVVLGTTTPVQAVVGEATFDPEGVLWAGCHVVPQRWVIESNAGDTGDAYNWLLDLLVHDAGDHYALAEQMARQHVDGATMMYAGPRIFDFSKIRPDRPGGILFPFPAMHSRPSAGELVRAFLESVAFAVRANMEQIRAVTGQWPSHLIAGGGMSRNRLLLEILADVTAMPVDAADEPESPALGVAMLLAQGAGVYPDVATAAYHMGRRHVVEPTPARIEVCRGKYAKWRELHDAFDTVSL